MNSIQGDSEHDSGHSHLLTLVARGTAIITEIYRLVELIPEPFLQTHYSLGFKEGTKDEQHTLDEIVFDFSYFKEAEQIEAKIEQNPVLKKADEQFCDNYDDILTRFYMTFESIHRYASDLNRFIVDLEEDVYIGQTLETLLLNTENRQLLCEAYFQLGYLLLLVDLSFDGHLRERLIVSFYRYSSYKSSPSTGLDGTCNLMRNTNFKYDSQKIYKSAMSPVYHRPSCYPEKYFARAEVNQTVINTLIAKLQIVDIYNKTVAVFPHPDHRSHALSQQASILYVLLYFCPNILKSQRSRMREITDKFFCDSWIIDVFMGERVNLIEAWQPYKAARESLIQILDAESVRNFTQQIAERFKCASKQINEQYLVEGWLNQDTFLDNHVKILNCLRDSNVILRWTLLHLSMRTSWQSFRLTKLLQTIVVATVSNERQLCEFLQRLAVLEKRVNRLLDEATEVRFEHIEENRRKACETLEDLISIFDDSQPMRWVKAGANLALAEILTKAKRDLVSADLATGRARDIVIKVINRIDSAREAYSDDRSLQVVQLFSETKQSLLKTLRNIDLDPNLKMILQSVGEFSYAWRLMDEFFTEHLQQTIKDNPFSMFGLEAIIMKLSSAFETQLLRIQQVEANADLVSVSQYHSTKLVGYIRHVLQVIPATIFELIAAIISIQSNNILDTIPAKISLNHLKDYALNEQRFKMLELTSKISNYAKGMMTMPNTTIGLVRLNSKQLLEDGMRRELAKRMTDSIQNTLQFQEVSSRDRNSSRIIQLAQNLQLKLEQLALVINGYKSSLEYIQDFLFIYGLRMWQEELARIIKSSFELANASVLDSAYLGQFSDSASLASSGVTIQSRPTTTTAAAGAGGGPTVPRVAPTSKQMRLSEGLQSSFLIRILAELLKATNPRETIYDEQTNAWYEQKAPHHQVADAKIFQLVLAALGVTGINCVDKLCCTLIRLELQRLNVFIRDSTSTDCMRDGASSTTASKTQPLGGALKFMDELRHGNKPSKGASGSGSSSSSNSSSSLAAQQYRQSMLRAFASCLSRFAPLSERLINHLLSIGQLQIIRLNIAAVLSTSCRYEARHLYACLSTLNATLLAALKHSKRRPDDSDQKHLPDSAVEHNLSANLSESELVFELTNHLEWVGLSDPMSKIYTFAPQQQQQQQQTAESGRIESRPTGAEPTTRCDVCSQSGDYSAPVSLICLLLIEQSSKFNFSRSLNGFVPKQARGFYESSSNVDALPLFVAIATLLHHYQPGLLVGSTDGQCSRCRSGPVGDLMSLMSGYVESVLGHPLDGASIKPQELTLEVVNMILSLIELSRQTRVEADAATGAKSGRIGLPKYILDTFQFSACHLNQ